MGTKKKRTTFTIREDVLNEAKRLDLNMSDAAETGIMSAIRTVHEKIWPQDDDRIGLAQQRAAHEGARHPYPLCSMCRYRRCCGRNGRCG